MLRSAILRARPLRSPCHAFRRSFASRAAAAPAAGTNSFNLSWEIYPGLNQKPKSLFQVLSGQSGMDRTPLTTPFLVPVPSAEIHVSGDIKVSRLANGVRVATRDFQTPVASVGIFVNAGSRDENASNSGASHFLETAAFATTRTRTDFRLIRDSSRIGASMSVSAGRESIAYTGEVLANWTRPLTETLADLVKRPMFIDFELRDLMHHYIEEAEHRAENHYENLVEQLHCTAYGNAGLGSPLFVPRHNFKKFKTPDTLKAFHSQFFTADRITLAAIGVPHDYFRDLAEQEFGDLEARPTPRAAANYTGGDCRMHAVSHLHTPFDEHNTHMAFAWQADGWTSPSVPALHVLSALLGGSRSALWSTAPAAARHVQTRLNTSLVASGVAEKAAAFASVFSDSALLAVYAQAAPDRSAEAAYALIAEVTKLASGNVSAVELNRAKLAAKAAVLWAGDSRSAALDQIGRQLLLSDTVQTPKAVAALIDAVQPADITTLAARVLKSPLTVVASGDVSQLPRYDQLVAKI